MDRQPEIVSFGSHGRSRFAARWAWVVVVACLVAALAHLAVATSQRDATIRQLRAALRAERSDGVRAPVSPAVPAESAAAFHTFPDGRASFSVFAAAISSRPGGPPALWLYIHGRAQPGQRYGLLGDTCGGQFVTPSDWADATADSHGNLTIVAPGLGVQPGDPRLYFLVYRLDSGDTLGGIKGPLLSGGATPFRRSPPC